MMLPPPPIELHGGGRLSGIWEVRREQSDMGELFLGGGDG